jgi:hypothetical protein
MTGGADLFSWRDEADAAAAAAAAEAARGQAERRARFAPRGTKVHREAVLRAATHDALRAEVALSRLKDGHG